MRSRSTHISTTLSPILLLTALHILLDQAARESIVLLKNDGLLPLSIGIKRVAVIGPNANITKTLLVRSGEQRAELVLRLKLLTPIHVCRGTTLARDVTMTPLTVLPRPIMLSRPSCPTPRSSTRQVPSLPCFAAETLLGFRDDELFTLCFVQVATSTATTSPAFPML